MTHPYTLNDRRDVYDVMPKDIAAMLDVGCSRGGFCQLVKSRRPETLVWAIEPDPDIASEAATHADHVIVGSFPEDIPVDTPPFDAVFFNDVLEHMVDPGAALEVAKRLLSSHGRIIASIPNIRHWSGVRTILVNGDFPYTEAGLFDRTHLRYFTRTSMIRLFNEHGYHVERCVPTAISRRLPARILRRVAPRFGWELSSLQFIIVARPEGNVPR
jgi:SAM-dependent methyltransferase